MDDLLIGYVLGALTAEESAQLEARLREDGRLRRRLEIVRRAVLPLAGDSVHETPSGLAARTCRLVRERREPDAQGGAT
jgi:anti-sigma-K factor RskA